MPSWHQLEDFDAGDVVVRPEGRGGSSDDLFTATAAESPARGGGAGRGRRARRNDALPSTGGCRTVAVTSIGRPDSAGPVPIAAAPVAAPVEQPPLMILPPAALIQMQMWLGRMQYQTMFPWGPTH